MVFSLYLLKKVQFLSFQWKMATYPPFLKHFKTYEEILADFEFYHKWVILETSLLSSSFSPYSLFIYFQLILFDWSG